MIEHLSFSSLSMFQRCGEQFRRRYIEGERIPPGVALIRGKAVDAAVSEAYRRKKEGATPMLDYLLDLAAQRAEEGFAGEVALTPEEASEGIKAVKGRIVDEATRLTSLHYGEVLPLVQPRLVQPKTEIEVPGLKVRLIGYLDVVEEDGTIRDTKTSRKAPPADAAEKSDQLAWYALGYRVATGKPSPRQILDYLVAYKAKCKWVPRSTVVLPQDSDRLLRRIRTAVQAIEAGIFPPANPDTWWCSPKWCGYYHTCPYVRRSSRLDLGGLGAKIEEER